MSEANIHASCVAIGASGVLLLGQSGAGSKPPHVTADRPARMDRCPARASAPWLDNHCPVRQGDRGAGLAANFNPELLELLGVGATGTAGAVHENVHFYA